ncbi:hypothetical protein EKO27_g4786 [Xylaria grammica]|uniref:Uncharacterized protein n=1 Tax=Xylaria grammica TaxID=363999 RepID=A0A439D7G0_9PEZI|nr:hypothetical protein EKO27_g4786 [Xylaria grammica]
MFTSLIFLALAITQSNAACYDASGIERNGFFPCNTSAEVSICCGGTDYCLDNGLCLDASGDNIFTVQACTSATWDAPCKQYCPGPPSTENWYQDLTLCKSTDKVSGSVFKPPGVSGDTSAPGSVPDESRNQSLKLGLGVGLGLGLGLLALALAFYAWELRKKNKYLKMTEAITPATPPPPPPPPDHKDLPWAQDNWHPPEELHSTTIKVSAPELHDTSMTELPGHEDSIGTNRSMLEQNQPPPVLV